jgi:hypothetical protein
MRYSLAWARFVAYCLAFAGPRVLAQNQPKLHELPAFMVKGGYAALVPELLKQRFSLKEIEEAHLNGDATDLKDVLGLMAKFEKLGITVAEPTTVRGPLPVYLPPNAKGDEAYTACFCAFTYNGLVMDVARGELELVRPETRPALKRPVRPWNRLEVLSTRLFRLGYLKPDPIMRQYRDKIGTNVGHAIVELNSNDLIIVDKAPAIEAMSRYLDSQVLEAMGVPASDANGAGEGLRPPSLGAIASRETIHFYLQAFARVNEIPLVASQQRGGCDRQYPEADLWTNEAGYRALAAEFQRVNEFVRAARESGGDGWVEPSPGRTFSPSEQKRLDIRYGVISQPAGTQKTKKAAKTAKKR